MPANYSKRFQAYKQPAINDVDGLRQAKKSLLAKRRKENPEKEYVTVCDGLSLKQHSANDDILREESFVQQARDGAVKALAAFKELKIPTKKPSDYKAEQMKDDKQMARVTNRLKTKKEAIERSEKSRKLRELKKMGKKIQQEVVRKRQKSKKEFLEKVQKARTTGKTDFLDE